MKILLAIDDSMHSKAATEAVLRQANPQSTEVYVLSVMEPGFLRTPDEKGAYYAEIDAEFREATERIKTLVAKTAELLRSKGFKSNRIFVHRMG